MWDEDIFGEPMGYEEDDDDLGKVDAGKIVSDATRIAQQTIGAAAPTMAAGKGPSVAGTGREAIRAMQRALMAAGCDVGPTGADGIIGQRTRMGMQCYVQRYGQAAFNQRFPGFASQMRVAPAPMPRAPAPGAAPTPETADMAPGPIALGPFAHLGMMLGDWKTLAAVGVVASAGYLGYRYYKSKKEEQMVSNYYDY